MYVRKYRQVNVDRPTRVEVALRPWPPSLEHEGGHADKMGVPTAGSPPAGGHVSLSIYIYIYMSVSLSVCALAAKACRPFSVC